jgi:fumarate reductase subunit D
MARSNEPLVWAPFSAGMMLDAMVVPALVVITGVLVPLGMVSEQTLAGLLSHVLTRLFVFVLVALSLFHAAHRIRFVLVDLGLKSMHGAIAVVMYGGAVVGTLLAAAAAFGFGDTCAWLVAMCGG